MVQILRPLLERFWVWLGGELPAAEVDATIEPGPDQFLYAVQPGDTLSSIARRFSTSVWILTDLNDMDDPSLIRVGRRLLIPRAGVTLSPSPAARTEPVPGPPVETEPGPFIYIVQTGDTLNAIARHFGVTVAAIVETNQIQDPSLIRPGQRVLIPGPELQPESEPSPLAEIEPVRAPPPPKREAIPLSLSRPPAPRPIPEPPPSSTPEPSPASTPEPLPASTPESVPTPGPEPRPGQLVYVVQPGDTMMIIARRFNVTLRAIIEANDVEDPDLIQPGQRLVIPGIPSVPTLAPGPEPTLPVPAPVPSPRLPDTLLSPIPWPEDAVRGIYVSYSAIGQEAHRRHVIDLLNKTEINALVIDVKGDHGFISYPTNVALAHDIGAANPTAQDFDELMDFFKANGVYTVARIVTFRDHPFAQAHPSSAAKQQEGGLWHDGEQLAWADPFAQAAWDYNADLAEEAARIGFDEIQFDYVRFPAPSQEGVPCFSQSLSREVRVAAITGFLSYARGRLASLDVGVAANVLGYTCWRRDDTLAGQDIARMARYLDVLCPMLYPSMFRFGVPGYPDAVAHPYEIVYESMKRAVDKVAPLGCRVRPWLQDFPDYRLDKRVFGPVELRVQMRGSFDGGAIGYMAWNPRLEYTMSAYFQKAIDMSLSDDYN